MQPSELIVVTKFAQVGLRVLCERLLTFVAMLASCGLFGWVMYSPDWVRFAGACGFALLVLYPLIRLDSAKYQERKEQQ